MDIAFINRALGMRRGGGEIWDLEMAKQLDSMGVDVTIYTGEPIYGSLEMPVDLPTKTVTSPFLYDLGYAAPIGIGGVITDIDRQLFISQVGRALSSEHDLVHMNSYPEMLRIKSSVDAPVTITLHGPPHSLFYDYIHPWKSSLTWLEMADAVVGTGITVSYVEENTNTDVTAINPGVDTARFQPSGEKQETDGPTILWVGRMVPAKDISELVDAFETVLEDYPDASLWLVGDGGRRSEIESQVDNRGIRDSVRFWGYVENEALPPFYRAADVFALSSKHESFGMVLLEAMACGTPVVAPHIDYIPEIITDMDTGLLYEKGNKRDFAANLVALLSDDALQDGIAKEAAKSTRGEHSWEERAQDLKQVFERTRTEQP